MVGAAAEGASFVLKRREWLSSAATGLLWLGTLAAWIAVGLGLLAEATAPHVPPAWEVLREHKLLGFWSAGMFSVLSLWRLVCPQWGRGLFRIVWFIAVGVLVVTGFHGGELVFHFGMGVHRP